jgi:4-amino-4-deoxy-L-arabinose transferase-like glycosyltransferase
MDFQKLKKYKWLILILFLALTARLISVFLSPVVIWDETVYANLGYDLSKQPFDYSFMHGWSDFMPDGSWPKAGFRAPLLPYILSIFYFLKLDFLVRFFIPLIGTLSVALAYLLGRKLFSEKAGLYSAAFFALLPLHVNYSGKILTDVFFTFFIMLSFFVFWKGYEENKPNYKIFFGIVLALALLARYTTLWIFPVFLGYFLIRDKSFKFLRDKHLWYAILAFFLMISPWLFYGKTTYGNLFGPFIHGFKASAYWGGVQSWHYLFGYWWQMFSIIGLAFIFSLIYIIYKKQFYQNGNYLLLIWFVVFLGMVCYMPHKEDRFLMAITPIICLITGKAISSLKRYRKLAAIGMILILAGSLSMNFYFNIKNAYTETNLCFLEGNKFLKDVDAESVIISDESPITYYYSHKATSFFAYPINLDTIRDSAASYEGKPVYAIMTDYDGSYVKDDKIRQELDSSLERVFECANHTVIYRVS